VAPRDVSSINVKVMFLTTADSLSLLSFSYLGLANASSSPRWYAINTGSREILCIVSDT
jgi:hypothetical protein